MSALALMGMLTGCTLMSGPEFTTTSAFDYKDRICPALSDAVDAGAYGDGEGYHSGVADAVTASEEFLEEYPESDEAGVLLEFSEVLRDMPPAGYPADDQAHVRKLFDEAGEICGTKP